MNQFIISFLNINKNKTIDLISILFRLNTYRLQLQLPLWGVVSVRGYAP